MLATAARAPRRGTRHRRPSLLAPLLGLLALVAVPAPPAAAGTAATWSSSLTRGGSVQLTSLSCPTTRVCYAAGGEFDQEPVVVRTIDGGRSWSRELLPSPGNGLSGISCASVQDCVVVQDGYGQGQVWSTSDAGATWTDLGPTGPQYVSSVVCAPSGCFLFGSQSVLALVSGRLDRAGVELPTPQGDALASVGDVTCDLAGSCFASGVVSSPWGPRLAIWQLDAAASTATLLGSEPTSASGVALSCTASACTTPGPDGLLVLDIASGTWTTAPAPALASGATAFACAGAVCVLAAITAHGELVAVVERSGTWTETGIAPTSPPTSGALECMAPGDCALAGFGTGVDEVWATSGSGTAWRDVGPTGGLGALDAVSCVGAACVAVGEQLTAVSSNAGASWVVRPARLAASLASVSCTSALDCVAVGSLGGAPVAERTVDGGARWSVSSVPKAAGALSDVACAASVCVAVTVAGGAVRSGDGGATWVTTPLSAMSAVACPTPRACVAVGENDEGSTDVARTTDGGAHWIEQAYPSVGAGFDAVSCPTATTCFALGAVADVGPGEQEPGVFVSTDGAVSWHLRGSPPWQGEVADTPAAIACKGSTCAVVLAAPPYDPRQATVSTSTDGGIEWSMDAMPPGDLAPDGLAATGLGHFIAVGANRLDGPFVAVSP